ncbi:MAG: hypothetical protein ACQERJ_09270 [Bacillota bacterium]
MKFINRRTIFWLFLTTLVYFGYYLAGFNQKIAQPILSSNLINNFWLQNKPLLWLYSFSIILVLIIGITSKIKEDRVQEQINQHKREKQRRNYSI